MKRIWWVSLISLFAIFFGSQFASASLRTLTPPQGGTGIGMATTSQIGQFLAVSSSNPFLWKVSAGVGASSSSPFINCAYFATSSAANLFGTICLNTSTPAFAFTSTDSSTPFAFPNSPLVFGTSSPFPNTFLTIDPVFMIGVTSTLAPSNPTVDAFTIGYDGANRNINTAFVIQNNNDPLHGLFMANQAEPDPITQPYMGYIRISGGEEQDTEWQTGKDFGLYPGQFSINPHQGTFSVGMRPRIPSSSIDSIYFNLASTTPVDTIASNTFAVMNGNVGIGTSTPTSALTVAGNGQFLGHLAIGAQGAINGGTLSGIQNDHTILDVEESVGGNLGATNAYGLDFIIQASSTSNNAGVYGILAKAATDPNDTHSWNPVIGVQAQGQFNSSSTLLSAVIGSYNSAIMTSGTSSGTGRVHGITAAENRVTISGGSTVQATGLYVDTPFQTGGSIANLYGEKIDDQQNGTSKNYALYTSETASSTNSTGAYALYNSGTAPSYFGGNVGIGTNAPTFPLTVVGTSSVGAIQFTGLSGGTQLYADSDTNTGINFPGPDIMQFKTAGINRMYMDSSGHSIIGQFSTPDDTLGVVSNGSYPIFETYTSSSPSSAPVFAINNSGNTIIGDNKSLCFGVNCNFQMVYDTSAPTSTLLEFGRPDLGTTTTNAFAFVPSSFIGRGFSSNVRSDPTISTNTTEIYLIPNTNGQPNPLSFTASQNTSTIAGAPTLVLANNDNTVFTINSQGLFLFRGSNTTTIGINTSTPDAALDVQGTVRFEGKSSFITPVISGIITTSGCDSVTSTVDSSYTTSSVAFVSTPQTFLGNGVMAPYTVLTSPGLATTYVCADITVTPNPSAVVVKIIK